MRELIYFTVFGCGLYSWCVQAAIHTLRHPSLGNYRGDIVVFTDDPLLNKILPEETRSFNLPEGDQFYWSLRARFDAGLLLEHGAYDRVMFCDADVLFAADIADLFGVQDKLHVCSEPTSLWRNQWAHAYLTADEMRDAQIAGSPTINAGTFIAPGPMAKDLLHRWRAFVEADPFRECVSHNQAPDQSALNAMIFRNEIPVQVMPVEWIVQPRPACDYPLAKVLHFTGKRKEQEMGRRLRALLELVK